MLTKEEIIKQVTEAKIFENKFFTKVWLIGSFACDEASANSDIDFLIEYNKDELNTQTTTEWSKAISFIETTFLRTVQMISTEAYEKFENSVEILIK
jgi:predicted nucleotidyltransferase